MADMMDTLRSILGDGADEKIQTAMEMLKSGGIAEAPKKSSAENLAQQIENDIQVTKKPNKNAGGLTPEGLEFANQIRMMVNQMSSTNDRRSDLLRSLKPFMRSSRQQTIERAIKIINLSRFSGIFGKL